VKCSRRSFIGLLAIGIVSRARSSAAIEGLWTAYGDFDAWALSNGEIVAVGSRLVVFDPANGKELRSASLSPPSAPDRVLGVTATPAAIVFGWYGWKGEGRVVCVDPRSLKTRWQRRIGWPDDERELSPGVFAVVRDDAIFVLLSGKRGENLFRLRPDTGETVWSRKIDRFVLGVPLAWRDGRLLVQSRITQHYPKGHGHYQAIDVVTGATLWQVRFDGTAGFWDDPPLIVGERAYLTCETSPGPSNHLYVIDIASATIVSQRVVQGLREPYAEHDGIVYFGTATPAAWDVRNDRVVWRSRLIRPYSTGPAIAPTGVFDAARRRIYLGDATDSLYKVSATDGTTIERLNIRAGYVNPARGINSGYGVRRMQLIGERLVIGTEDGRLLALAAAS
jgi:outer membrane protein assembly factor BamB